MAGGQPSPQPWAQNLYPPRTSPQVYKRERPTGVVVIAVLMIISAILVLILGLAMLAIGALAGIDPAVGGDLTALFALIGVVLVIFGVLYLVLAWGLLRLRSWARRITRGLTLLSIVFGLPAIFLGDPVTIINVIINCVIFFYLGTQDVKAAFAVPRFSVPQGPRHY